MPPLCVYGLCSNAAILASPLSSPHRKSNANCTESDCRRRPHNRRLMNAERLRTSDVYSKNFIVSGQSQATYDVFLITTIKRADEIRNPIHLTSIYRGMLKTDLTHLSMMTGSEGVSLRLPQLFLSQQRLKQQIHSTS